MTARDGTRTRERILFGAAPKRLLFDLRDLRDALFEAREKLPHSAFVLSMIKHTSKGSWPTAAQLDSVNCVFRQLEMPESTCMTRDKVFPRTGTGEPTKAELLARDCASVDAMHAARPLKPPVRAASYEPVPSEVLKLRAKDAHPDHDGFREAFLRERLR